MTLVDVIGAGAAATSTFIEVVHELNGSRSAVLQVDNNTKGELRRIHDSHSSGGFKRPPEFVIPPGKSDIFSARDSAFSAGTGTEGTVTYVGAGYFLTIMWNVPFIGANKSTAVISDPLASLNRFHSRSATGVGNADVHMHYDVSAHVLEFGSIPEKVAALASGGFDVGPPNGPVKDAPDNYGRFQVFQNASVLWSPSTGAHEVHGAILRKYRLLGFERYGYPFSDELVPADGEGRFNHFQLVFPSSVLHESIYWHHNLHPTDPMLAAHEVRGAIRDKWAELGWETGFLGYPVTDEQDWGGAPHGRTNEFQGGTIVWDPVLGARVQAV
jgi:hypothetical protein